MGDYPNLGFARAVRGDAFVGNRDAILCKPQFSKVRPGARARKVAGAPDCLGFLSLGRRRLMQESLQAPTFGGGIRDVRRRGRDLFAAVCEQDLEGIVAK